MLLRAFLISGLLSLRAFAAATGLEFTGVMSDGKLTKVALRDPASGVSRWLNLGERFAGYTVTAYDAKDESVTLTKDNVTRRVKLSSAKVQPTALVDVGVPPEIERPVLNNLRQISAAADQYFLENGVTNVTLAELVGPTKYIKTINPVRGEDYSTLQLTQGVPAFSVRTADGYSVTYERSRPGNTYSIRAGDTLFQIARQTGTTPQKLIELNGLSGNGATLQAGQVLKVK